MHSTVLNKRHTFTFKFRMRSVLMALMMFAVGIPAAWGQDLSGYYYIANFKLEEGINDRYNINTPELNYYLCPTENFAYYNSATTNYQKTPDNGMPFMTTYRGKADADYNMNHAIWKIEKQGDFYTILHAATNKYLTFNPKLTSSTNENRMRVHLEASGSVNDNILYRIIPVSGTTRYYIKPKSEGENGKSLNPAKGNLDNLSPTTDVGKNGVTGISVNGIIGIYTAANNNDGYGSQWCLEPFTIPVPTFTVSASGHITISSEEGTEIHYTTDGTEPTVSSPTYSAVITDISDISMVNAIAVRPVVNVPSEVVSLPVQNYTYHIVNLSRNITFTHTVKQAAGKPLAGYNDIPDAIRSSYIADENIQFYSFSGDFDSAKLIDENKIAKTPTDVTDIYVTYTTTNLSEKFLPLTKVRPYNLREGDNYLYGNDGLGKGAATDEQKKDNAYLWYFLGSDPYDVTIQNIGKTNFLTYSSPDLGLGAAQSFILKDCEDVEPADPLHYEILQAMR